MNIQSRNFAAATAAIAADWLLVDKTLQHMTFWKWDDGVYECVCMSFFCGCMVGAFHACVSRPFSQTLTTTKSTERKLIPK